MPLLDYPRALSSLRSAVTARAAARERLRSAALSDLPDLLRDAVGYDLPACVRDVWPGLVADEAWAGGA